MHYYGKTDKGRKRSINEDALLMLAVAPFCFFMVADGMGGHAAGEVASKMAVASLKRYFLEEFASLESLPENKNLQASLAGMTVKANSLIWEASLSYKEQQGMGTTLTAALFFGEEYCIGQVGDSRGYLIKPDEIIQVTRDHSLVKEMVDNGQINKQDMHLHPKRNILTKALGTEPHIEPDFYKGTLQTGETLLLCTDGLTSLLSEEEIFRTVKDISCKEKVVKDLVAMANDRGGHDNITIVLIHNTVS